MKKVLVFLNLFVSINLFCQPVIDNGKFINSEQIEKLTEQINTLESKTTIQILLFTTESMNGKSSEEFSMQLAMKYRVGQKNINNGIIILLCRNPRTVQILNGYGLEWILSDEVSNELVDKMIPYFRNGQFFEGISSTITQIDSLTSKFDWSVNSIKLTGISQKYEGKIIMFNYKNTSGNLKYKYAIDTDNQFSEEFKMDLSEDYKLFYSKYMNDLVGKIVSGSEVTIYARVKDFKNGNLELLGIGK